MNMMELETQKWNDRYSQQGFAFGTAPNFFFKEWLVKYPPGRILLPAEGEGRNGVFAALQGWQVTAFDLSTSGRAKAMQLAQSNKVTLDYLVGDFENIDFDDLSFDAIGLIYAHFTADKKTAYHKKLMRYIKPGGIIIFEAFSKQHLAYRSQQPGVGGPTALGDLYSEEEIKADFADVEILHLATEVITLHEGLYHNGQGSVIRFVGRKKSNLSYLL